MKKKESNWDRLQVLADNILVEEILEDVDMDGVVQTVQYEDKAFCGRVLKAGEKVRLEKGSTVFFNKYAAVEFPFEGKKFLVLKEEDIVAYY